MSLASIKIKSESYDAAKKLLAEAQLILPKDKFPKVKLKEIENILKKKAANKSKYDKLIAEASSLLVSKSYEKSKAKYQSASELLPEDYYFSRMKRYYFHRILF